MRLQEESTRRAPFSDVNVLILSSVLEKELLTSFGIPQSQKRRNIGNV